MRRTVIITSFALVSLTQATADAQAKLSYWQKKVDSDKDVLTTKIANMEGAAKEYRRASENRSHAATFSLNLAEETFQQAHSDASTDKQQAMSDFNDALSNLKSTSPTGNWREAEKLVRQKSAQVDKVERQEGRDARNRLSDKRKDASSKVTKAFNEAKDAASNLLRDRSHLEKAMRHAGRSEHEYERMSDEMEHHAEHQRAHAEQNKDEAADAVEHIFEAAKDHLEDREQRQRDASSDEREHAMDEAVDTLRSQQRRQQTAQVGESASASSAINLLATKSKSDDYTSKHEEHQEHEEDAQQAIRTDKSKLHTAMDNLEKVSNGFQYSVKNRTHAEALGANIARGVFNEAAEDSKDAKDKAVSDFNTYLSDLKAATPTEDYSRKVKTVKEQARYLDKLDHDEDRDARKRLHAKRDAQKHEVRESYHEAHRASKSLLHDKNRLMSAQRRAGEKESVYEGDEEKNEMYGEHAQDQAEDKNDNANDAAETIFELADQNLHVLQRANHKDQREYRRQRREAIYDAVETLKYAREGKTYHRDEARRFEKRGDDENENELQKIQQQMENLQKGMPPTASPASEEFFVIPADVSSLGFLAAASLGLLIFFYLRPTRSAPRAKPLLG